MYACVAVTCWGWGDVWGFQTAEEARLHPLIDTCDVILSGPDAIPKNWTYLFLPRMVDEVLGNREVASRLREMLNRAEDGRGRDDVMANVSQGLWNQLNARAKAPPTNPKTICEMIVADRKRADEWHRREANRRSTMNAPATGSAPAAAKEEKPKTIAGKAPTAKVAFGKDKEGKPYNTTDNNPKRAGSKSGDRFAKYKAGQTLEEAVAAGITPADIKWDIDHGYITAG